MCPHCVYTISEDVVAADFSFERDLWQHSVCSSQVYTSTRHLGSWVNSSGKERCADYMSSPTDC